MTQISPSLAEGARDNIATASVRAIIASNMIRVGSRLHLMEILLCDRDALLSVLQEAIPELEAAALAEARRNTAPTGIISTAKQERFERARTAIKRATGTK